MLLIGRVCCFGQLLTDSETFHDEASMHVSFTLGTVLSRLDFIFLSIQEHCKLPESVHYSHAARVVIHWLLT